MDGDKELGKLNPFRYRSYYYDEDISMYYLQSRYYDAEIGRFINADDVNLIPTMQTGIKGTNLFEYCDDNPVNKEDPTGEWSKKSIINGLKKIVKSIWNLFMKTKFSSILNFLGNVTFFASMIKFAVKGWKRVYPNVKALINAFIKLIKHIRWRWTTFKAGVTTTRYKFTVGIGIIAGVFVTALTALIVSTRNKAR